MLTYKNKGTPIGIIEGGKYNGKIISLDTNESDDGENNITFKGGTLIPILNVNEREVSYIAGPSGSGKSTYAANLITNFKKIYKKADCYFFSRTNYKDDPAYKNLKLIQIKINDDLINDPIDISEIPENSLVVFDDVTTIRDETLKNEIQKLACDILEVGRKLKLYIIFINHLVNPNEKKFGRTIMNELQSLTFFPKSGSSHQIKYCLKNYFGLAKEQIDNIFKLKSRWITIKRNYPQTVLYSNGAYIL